MSQQTADDKPAPTEEQVKQANDAEMAKWAGDYKEDELKIPYKREEENDSNSKDTKTSKSVAKSDTKTETEENDEASETDEPSYTEPAPVVTVEDPGEYKPADYSFEIEIEGKKHKVDTPEKAAELADEYAEKLNAKQLLELISKGSKIELKQERDKDKWEKQKADFDAQNEIQESRNEYNVQVGNEINYLITSGQLPEITDPAVKTRWETDPNAWKDKEFIKSDGVKEQVALLNRLAKERENRQKAGLSPNVSAIEVWKDMKNEVKKTEEAAAEAGEQRKAASSRVAGVSSSAQAPYVPKGIAVGDPNAFKRNQAVWDR